jgi:hypothetical protein
MEIAGLTYTSRFGVVVRKSRSRSVALKEGADRVERRSEKRCTRWT